MGRQPGARRVHARGVEAGAGAGAHDATRVGHGFDLHVVLVHDYQRAADLLPHHVAGAQRAHHAFGGLDRERAVRIGAHRDRDGAFEQMQAPVGGREFQVDPAAGVQQQFAAVRQHVAAPLAGVGGRVGGQRVERIEAVADVGRGGQAGAAQRQGADAAEEMAPRRHGQRLGGQLGGRCLVGAVVAGRIGVAQPAGIGAGQGTRELLPGVLVHRVGVAPRQEPGVVGTRGLARAQQQQPVDDLVGKRRRIGGSVQGSIRIEPYGSSGDGKLDSINARLNSMLFYENLPYMVTNVDPINAKTGRKGRSLL
ncbi:Uncharacterised protein [Bordetella pertussis]|nr:Uncharacterised protein [Bordetella pertussis]